MNAVDFCVEKYLKAKPGARDPRLDPKPFARLQRAASQAKKVLSTVNEAVLQV